MTTFPIGATIWVARAGGVEKTRPCRICAGQRTVTLILGTGEHVALECGACTFGYQPPTGTETYHEWEAKAVAYRVDSVEMKRSLAGADVTYRSVHPEGGHWIFGADKCFATPEEAAACCAELAATRAVEEERLLAAKSNDKKSYAWHAGYYLRKAREDRASAERCELKARIMQEKSRTPVTP